MGTAMMVPSSCSADCNIPTSWFPTGAGLVTSTLSGSRFRTSSTTRSMPSATICREDRGPSASAPFQAMAAARRSNRTTPATVSVVSPSTTTTPDPRLPLTS